MRRPLTAITVLLAGLALPLLASAPARATTPLCTYAVTVTGLPPAVRLDVRLQCAETVTQIGFSGAGRATIRDVRDLSGQPATASDSGWLTGAGGLLYTVNLAQGAQSGRGMRDTVATDDTVMTTLDAWLGMPGPAPPDAVLHVTLTTPPGIHVLHAMPPVIVGPGNRFALTRAGLGFAGYAVFSQRPGIPVSVPGRDGNEAAITVHAAATDFAVGEAALAEWVSYFAALSAAYWQGFPVDRLLVAILPSGDRDAVTFGRVRGGGGATLQVVVGRTAGFETLYRRDWILTHEMLHLAQPLLPRDGTWLMEGMATYVEPLLRHFAGLYRAEQVWDEWVHGMSNGALALNLEGLTRGNPYWTGALALLATHVAILQRTNAEGSMADCLRAGLAQAGNTTRRARTGHLIRACDTATGGTELSAFADRYTNPNLFDLPQFWQQLGITRTGNGAVYNENPTAAWLRGAILSPPPGFRAPPLPKNVATFLGVAG